MSACLHAERRSSSIWSLSSVVEELVCNSLEAGATRVDVSVCCAGGFVSCSDNGCGVSMAQLALLGRRSCTNKAGHAGNTLADLAALSVLEVETRASRAWDTGICLLGSNATVGLASLPRAVAGTTVRVRSFLHSLPVRRLAMQADERGELLRCRERVLRFALCRTDAAFSLSRAFSVEGGGPDTSILSAAAHRSLRETLRSSFGPPVEAGCVAVNAAHSGWVIHGLVSTPSATLPTREAQHVFVHLRWLRPGVAHTLVDSLASAARGVAACRSGRRSAAQHSIFVLHLAVADNQHDGGAVDMTPEGACLDPRAEASLLSAVRHAVLQAWQAAGVAANASPAPQSPAPLASPCASLLLPPWASSAKRARVDCCAGCDAPGKGPPPALKPPPPASLPLWRRTKPARSTPPHLDERAPEPLGAAAGVALPTAADVAAAPTRLAASALRLPLRAICGSVCDSVLLCVSPATLFAFDQHACDERVLLEGLSAHSRGRESRAIAPPAALQLTPQSHAALGAHFGAVAAAGWGVEPRSGEGDHHQTGAVAIHAAPLVCGVHLPPAALAEWLHVLALAGGACPPCPATKRLLASKACRGAVMFGDSLRQGEAQHLVSAVAKCADPLHCAHGRPAVVPLADLAVLARVVARSEASDAARRAAPAVSRRRVLLL